MTEMPDITLHRGRGGGEKHVIFKGYCLYVSRLEEFWPPELLQGLTLNFRVGRVVGKNQLQGKFRVGRVVGKNQLQGNVLTCSLDQWKR